MASSNIRCCCWRELWGGLLHGTPLAMLVIAADYNYERCRLLQTTSGFSTNFRRGPQFAMLMINICMKKIEGLSSRLLTAAAGPINIACHASIKNMHKNHDDECSRWKLRGGLVHRTTLCDANHCCRSQFASHTCIKYMHEKIVTNNNEREGGLMWRMSPCDANRYSELQSACHAGINICIRIRNNE